MKPGKRKSAKSTDPVTAYARAVVSGKEVAGPTCAPHASGICGT